MISAYTLFSGSGGNCIYVKNNDTEIFNFILKRADYKNFASACEARRKELFGKKQKEK